MSNYQIVKSQLRLFYGIAGHNLLVLKDDMGNVIEEYHGLATSINGAIKSIGYLPSDRLQFHSFNRMYLYKKTQSQVVLYEGTKKEVLAKWDVARNMGNRINKKNYGYPILGIGPAISNRRITWAKNSNSVASTLINAMDIKELNVPNDRITPGRGYILL